MSSRTAHSILSMASVVVGLAGPRAPACDCFLPPPPAEALAAADFVFSGVAASFELADGDLLYRFEVERVWKGAVPERLVVVTSASGATCGYDFILGRRYIVYADFLDPEAYNCERNWLQVRTGLCHRTREHTDGEAAALGDPRWRAPGAPFRRGDTDAGGEMDISDMVGILLHLFSGGPPGPCEDAMDTNDDGALDLTDAVYGLSYLFTGGPAPPEPGPAAPGLDPTTADPYTYGDALQLECPSDSRSTLPGVRLEIAGGPCLLTLEEAAAGVTFTYRVVVEADQPGVVTKAIATCQQPGPSALYLLPMLSNEDASFCICDGGHCRPLESNVHLIEGVYTSTLSWCGRSWFGPSDFQNPVGEPFPPGTYRFEVRGEGKLPDDAPWEVSAGYVVELFP